ncbi:MULTISPECIES: carboxypeptidase regulatory-like domain-containing protein [Methanocalculus]|uniref:carboxypeptidase regulatory-like domain-containing protein n=1 Tax=Methanocalculus TaxID=71151 RepID=UPI00209E0D9B|nr:MULTISPECIES: carboxypeptidase regulatory-like domain-containing protein [unclassified Methanocalculus]MCP1662765.1 hypothetical protein [Methanocalculus sp. AMF5]
MKKLLILSIIILFLFGAPVVAASEEDEKGDTFTLDVTVKDSDSDPISDASVKVDDKSKDTSADGKATIGLENGTYSISVSHEDYEDSSQDVTIDGEDKTMEFTLTLKQAEESGGENGAGNGEEESGGENGAGNGEEENGGENGTEETEEETESPDVAHTVTLTVKDSSNNNPVSGARVRIEDDDAYSSVKTTNVDGEVSFSLYDGDYQVYVSNQQYRDCEEELRIDGSDSSDTFYLERGNNIDFLILDADTNVKLYGARVAVNGEEVGISGTDGIVSDSLRKGGGDEYRISVTRSGYTANITRKEIALDEREIILLMTEGEATPTPTATATPTATPLPVQTYGAADQAEMDRLAAEREEIEREIAALEQELEQQGIVNQIISFFKGLFGMK